MNTKVYTFTSLLMCSLAACALSPNDESKDAVEEVSTVQQNVSASLKSAFPENDLNLQDNPSADTGISEDEFHAVLDQLRFLYNPLVLYHGGQLDVVRNWSSSTVNAYANQIGTTWKVEAHGGLARRSEMTADGFALVMCHEFGHHLAGYPFYDTTWLWAAAEGQSDWYAAQACTRWLWLRDTEGNAKFRTTANSVLRGKCDAQWTVQSDRDLCYRIGMAAKSMADLMAALGREAAVDFSKQDTNEVKKTSSAHPAAQCRLDTAVAAALCTVTPNLDIIPGLKVATGRNSVLAEVEAAAVSCHPASGWIGAEGYNHQDHPRCWFKNQLSGAGITQ